MRPLIVALTMVVATGACWYPDKGLVSPDAPPPDAPPVAPPGQFPCLGKGPGPVQETVTISATVQDALNGKFQGVTSVSVEVVQTNGIVFVPAMSVNVATGGGPDDGKATYSVTHTTGMAKRDIYFHVHANGYLDTYYYPALSLVADLHVDPILLFPTDAMAQLVAALKQMGLTVTPDSSKATVIVGVVNCQDAAVGAAKVKLTPSAGTMVYLDSGVNPNVNATETDPMTGAALILNAPPVSITVDATVAGMSLYSHPITGFANSVTQTEIQPGYP
jgi:hypothetical protein